MEAPACIHTSFPSRRHAQPNRIRPSCSSLSLASLNSQISKKSCPPNLNTDFIPAELVRDQRDSLALEPVYPNPAMGLGMAYPNPCLGPLWDLELASVWSHGCGSPGLLPPSLLPSALLGAYHGSLVGPCSFHGSMVDSSSCHSTLVGSTHGTLATPGSSHGSMVDTSSCHGTMVGSMHGTIATPGSSHGSMADSSSCHSSVLGRSASSVSLVSGCSVQSLHLAYCLELYQNIYFSR